MIEIFSCLMEGTLFFFFPLIYSLHPFSTIPNNWTMIIHKPKVYLFYILIESNLKELRLKQLIFKNNNISKENLEKLILFE